MEPPSWPSHLLAEAQVRSWISIILPKVSHVDGPIRIEQVKSWGVVARFRVQSKNSTDQEVIFKASHLPLFTYGWAVYTDSTANPG